MSNERDEVAAARKRRDYLLSNYVEEEGPLETPCWIWQRGCVAKGYGSVMFGGFSYQAHRLMWVLANAPIPGDLLCLHHCDVPACLNPDHLFLGDHQANSDDKCQKGREAHLVGSQHGMSLLNETKVAQILDLVVNQRKSITFVAIEFGVSPRLIHGIAFGQFWTHVPGPRQQPQAHSKTSQFIGVTLHSRGWQAYANANGKRVHLGYFDTEVSAAIARNAFDISRGRPPSNLIPEPELPEWSTPVLEEITFAQWERMQRGPGDWVPLQNEIENPRRRFG
jgi:hypothetical protein